MKHRLLLNLVLLFLSSAEGLAADAPESLEKPNIVFILADDLGQRDLGCYGSTFNETPHLDRLAKEGALFTDAYASCPVCSPTRASLMTGLIWTFENERRELFNLASDIGEQSNLIESEPARAQVLQQSLHAWQKDVGAKMPTLNAKYDPLKPNGRFAARNKSAPTP